MSKEVRALIFQMVAENPTWGAPRIHGELLMLGFDLSEPTVSRWMRRAPRPLDPAKRWLTFLRNHPEAIAAMDFFPVPTLTFGIMYCFFVIGHHRRRILHFNVTRVGGRPKVRRDHDQDAAKIRQLRDDGESLQAIADELGRSKSDIARVARTLNCSPAASAPAMLV